MREIYGILRLANAFGRHSQVILNLAEGIKPVNPAEAVEHDVISIFNDFLSTHGPLRTQGFLGTVGKINALVFEVVPQQLRTSYF